MSSPELGGSRELDELLVDAQRLRPHFVDTSTAALIRDVQGHLELQGIILDPSPEVSEELGAHSVEAFLRQLQIQPNDLNGGPNGS